MPIAELPSWRVNFCGQDPKIRSPSWPNCSFNDGWRRLAGSLRADHKCQDRQARHPSPSGPLTYLFSYILTFFLYLTSLLSISFTLTSYNILTTPHSLPIFLPILTFIPSLFFSCCHLLIKLNQYFNHFSNSKFTVYSLLHQLKLSPFTLSPFSIITRPGPPAGRATGD